MEILIWKKVGEYHVWSNIYLESRNRFNIHTLCILYNNGCYADKYSSYLDMWAA